MTRSRNPRAFFDPLCIGAPRPAVEVAFGPSRMIHFFDPSNARMVERIPALADRVDILLGNLEDAIPVDRKDAARRGLIDLARSRSLEGGRLWPRINSLDSPWLLPDVTELVLEAGRQIEVLMVPKVEGPTRHPLPRPPHRPPRSEGRYSRGPIGLHTIVGDVAGHGQPGAHRQRRPAHAGDELRSGRPGGLPPRENPAARWTSPRLPSPRRPHRRHGRPRLHDPGPLALLDRPDGRCLHRRSGSSPFYGPFGDIGDPGRMRVAVPIGVHPRVRRRMVAAPHRRSRSPVASSAPTAPRRRQRPPGAWRHPRRAPAST